MENVVPIKPQESNVEAKERTVRAFVLIHSLLADGLFPGKLSLKLSEARGFIEMVHNEAMKTLEADPAYQEKVKKEKEDGNKPERPTNQTEEGSPPQTPTT